jgi:hypothetical protein
MKPDQLRDIPKVIKSSGECENFSVQKFRRSIRRTGLEVKECNAITRKIVHKIHPSIKTKEIYKEAYKLIKRHSSIAAIHYSLKKSILELGPTGFIFELFVSRYFESLGYKTSVGITLQGQFVKHEVDVLAQKGDYQICVECKFHNTIRFKNDVKVVLYVKARWDDLVNGIQGNFIREFYVVSNTEFTKDAIEYARGSGLKLLGVNTPESESFLDVIKKYKLYPITCLKRLKKIYCQELFREKLILCSDLLTEKKTLLRIGMSEDEVKNLFSDINKIME